MKNKYSDSLFPFGIGTTFCLILMISLFTGAIMGYLLRNNHSFEQGGGIILLIIIIILFVVPMFGNRKKSHFEQNKKVLAEYDGIGTIQGLRGAMFRLVIYEEGMEIRALYHRYYIPFKEIKKVEKKEGYFSKRLDIVTGISGIPDYIESSDKKFWELAELIKKRINIVLGQG